MEDSECDVPNVPLATYDVEIEDDADKSAPEDYQANLFLQQKKESTPSLEDLNVLVQTFDHEVKNLLNKMDQPTDSIAPIQIRSQEEVMQGSEVWWTLSGDFGNLAPLDFSKSLIRKRQIDALGLSPRISENSNSDVGFGEMREHADEDDLRNAMDIHRLASLHHDFSNDENQPISAEQVIEEIDELITMMQNDDNGSARNLAGGQEYKLPKLSLEADSVYSSILSPSTVHTDSCTSSQANNGIYSRRTSNINFDSEELQQFSQSKLLTIYAELESLVQQSSNDLIAELAYRDELEYDKEVKNTFITLAIEVRERFKKASNSNSFVTSIPYNKDRVKELTTASLDALNKVLQSILDESTQAPKMLTDYILNVVCPPSQSK